MDKSIIEDIYNKNENEWNFPRIEFSIQHYGQDDSEEKREIDITEIEKIKIENEAKKIELDNLKIEYEQKITILDNILNQLKTPLDTLDDEVIDMINAVIKKSIKNIIYKEIKLDQKILIEIINTLREQIQKNDGMFDVYLSKEDADKLSKNKDSKFSLKVDEKLLSGDLIIKSNTAEIRSVISERIDKILGCKK